MRQYLTVLVVRVVCSKFRHPVRKNNFAKIGNGLLVLKFFSFRMVLSFFS